MGRLARIRDQVDRMTPEEMQAYLPKMRAQWALEQLVRRLTVAESEALLACNTREAFEQKLAELRVAHEEEERQP